MMMYKNNPFNIRSGSKWLGLSGSFCGFCEFSEKKYGIRAALILLTQSYRKKRITTLHGIIHRYAPPYENPTKNYLSFIVRRTNIPPRRILTDMKEYVDILYNMAYFETGFYCVSVREILDVVEEFNIKLYGK